jgi:hypothetical protein
MGDTETTPTAVARPYACQRTSAPIVIDGVLDDPAWTGATWSPRFGDMVTGRPGLYDTRAALVWDDEALYVGYRVEEPFLAATMTERDSLLFLENDVEVFVDGGDWYYELELNALGTVYEALFVWRDAYATDPRYAAAGLDVLARDAVSFGGDDERHGATFWTGSHPRGLRWAFRDWDYPGMRSAVALQGTLNDDTDIDQGWTVEIALPWAGLGQLPGGQSLPPRAGDRWRLFLGRFQRLELSGAEVRPHPAWTWTRQARYDTHRPEDWLEVEFRDEVVGSGR